MGFIYEFHYGFHLWVSIMNFIYEFHLLVSFMGFIFTGFIFMGFIFMLKDFRVFDLYEKTTRIGDLQTPGFEGFSPPMLKL